MATPQSGPGIGLPQPQYLYPTQLLNAPNDLSNNYVNLGPGQVLPIPAGTWYIIPGPYTLLQYGDPVSGIWRSFPSALSKMQYVNSDGFNYRLANLTGCPVAAVVTNAGNGSYVQATTTVVAGSGNSTWSAIVGGMVTLSTIAIAGSGYGVAPQLLIPAPPSPGVQATAYATIQSGTVASVTMTNWGGGYPSAPTVTVAPNPADPNFLAGSAIVPAQITMKTFGSGSIAAVLCTNSGVSIASAPTLTIAGAGASATATALMLQTATAITVTGAGTGWTGGAGLTTVGGWPAAVAVNTNPSIELTGFIPRPAQMGLAVVGASLVSIAATYDGGLFLGAPSVVVSPLAGIIPTTAASIQLTLGAAADVNLIQNAP